MSLGILSLLGAAAAGAQPAPTPLKRTPPSGKTQPLDPLTAEEKKAAERLAAADNRVQELLGSGAHRLIYVEFLSLKSGEAGGAERAVRGADVVFYQRERDLGVRAIVNLDRRSVEQVVRLDSLQVPMNSDDLAEALQIALKDGQIRRLLGPDADRYRAEGAGGAAPAGGERFVVRPLRLDTTDEKDPCWKDRCLQLFFRRGDAYLTDLVVVDLTTRQVRVERGQQ